MRDLSFVCIYFVWVKDKISGVDSTQVGSPEVQGNEHYASAQTENSYYVISYILRLVGRDGCGGQYERNR
jgi:hypothetical protein